MFFYNIVTKNSEILEKTQEGAINNSTSHALCKVVDSLLLKGNENVSRLF